MADGRGFNSRRLHHLPVSAGTTLYRRIPKSPIRSTTWAFFLAVDVRRDPIRFHAFRAPGGMTSGMTVHRWRRRRKVAPWPGTSSPPTRFADARVVLRDPAQRALAGCRGWWTGLDACPPEALSGFLDSPQTVVKGRPNEPKTGVTCPSSGLSGRTHGGRPGDGATGSKRARLAPLTFRVPASQCRSRPVLSPLPKARSGSCFDWRQAC
jgi:hypothetical protein